MAATVKGRFIKLMNRYGAEKVPFLFIIDFDMKCPEIHKISTLPSGIRFSTPLLSNISGEQLYNDLVLLEKFPVPFSKYDKAFQYVMRNITIGNTYLLNLTFPTLVKTKCSLEEIFSKSSALYKLFYKNRFIVFSPEIFVRIKNGIISSFPMKGTIDSSVENAEYVILNDRKEEAEHNTIVDLIRNDLSRVAYKVNVKKHRYIDIIHTGASDLIHVSSEISGVLHEGYESRLGDIITGLLPAGSITGAPKKETVRIKECEEYDRRWYTGIFGVFDGNSLDSGVMIRYIERDGEDLYFKSGGGITYMSDPVKEYEELISKVYVPAG
jgi:para-aminobenzoate synthetase component 1